MNTPSASARKRLASRRKLGHAILCLAVMFPLAGCSLFVMAGKMFFGDPKLTSPFRAATDVDLTDGKHSVIVVCSAPLASTDQDMTSVSYQLVADVSRKLRRQNVDVISSNKVRDWMDDNGGLLDDPRQLADEFDVDYIIHIDLQQITYHEENSPDLYRGNASGEVVAYEVSVEDGNTISRQVFSSGFNSLFPTVNPIPAIQVDSPRIFQKRFLERIGVQVSHLFYDHRQSEAIF